MSRNTLESCGSSDYRECAACGRKGGWISVFANLGLALFKALVGFISGSKAILADSLYSFKDFLTALVVVIGLRVSGKPADERHPYGHGKVEFVGMLLISVFLFIATIFLFIHSVKDVWLSLNGEDGRPTKMIAFWAAIISMIANYKIASYIRCIGEKIKSPAMLANAKHNHSDAISSGVVAVAIFGTNLGFYILDPLAAVIETLDLMRLNLSMLRESIKGILDASVHPELVEKITSIALFVPGVRRVSSVKARKLGHNIWIDIVIKVDHHQTHEVGYRIGEHVKESLIKGLGNVSGVTISVNPYMP